MLEFLPRTLDERMPELGYDLCTSRDHAIARLILAPPYQIFISSVHLAEMDNFLLLERNHTLHPSVPCVVTATPPQKESALGALTHGAFDVVTNSLDPEELQTTIRLALWQNRLLRLLASREKVQERYRQHSRTHPLNKSGLFQRALLSMNNTISVMKTTEERMKESIACLTCLAMDMETRVRDRAIERLNRRHVPKPVK